MANTPLLLASTWNYAFILFYLIATYPLVYMLMRVHTYSYVEDNVSIYCICRQLSGGNAVWDSFSNAYWIHHIHQWLQNCCSQAVGKWTPSSLLIDASLSRTVIYLRRNLFLSNLHFVSGYAKKAFVTSDSVSSVTRVLNSKFTNPFCEPNAFEIKCCCSFSCSKEEKSFWWWGAVRLSKALKKILFFDHFRGLLWAREPKCLWSIYFQHVHILSLQYSEILKSIAQFAVVKLL